MQRFWGDLWNADRETISEAATAILKGRDHEVKEVYRITSGLYATVVLTSSRHVNLSADEIRSYVWRNTEA